MNVLERLQNLTTDQIKKMDLFEVTEEIGRISTLTSEQTLPFAWKLAFIDNHFDLLYR
jgi:hypothetical protein